MLSELVRVCKPGGLVSVIDVAPEPDKLEAYDRAELLRDPSHARACSLPQLEALFCEHGLVQRTVERYQLAMPFERQLEASFPQPGDGEQLRALFRADADSGEDRLSMNAHYEAGELYFAYPCVIVVGEKR